MATLLETDIAHLSENIAQQYATPAQYFEDQSIKRRPAQRRRHGRSHRRQQGRQCAGLLYDGR